MHSKLASLRLLAAAAALVLGTLPAAHATILLNEDFSDLERLTDHYPDSSHWVTISGSSTLVATSGSLVQTVTTSNRSIYTFFTSDAAPQTLAVGESLRASFTLTINGTIGTNNDALRLGLLNSFATSADDNATASAVRSFTDGVGIGASPMPDASGYFFSLNASPTSDGLVKLWQRGDGSPGVLNTGYATQIGDAGGADLNFIAGLPYATTLTVLRTGADTATITLSLSGSFLDAGGDTITAEQTLSADAPSGIVYNFDTFGLFAGSNFATSIAIDDFKVEHLAAPAVPQITTQPAAQTVTEGSDATFTVLATGEPAPAYQWQKDGVALDGETSATLRLTVVQIASTGSYTVVVSNSAGSVTSEAALLTVNPPSPSAPAITVQPGDQNVPLGGTATFTVTATGTPTPSYQWKKDGEPIAGAINATFSIAAVTADDAGSYTVEITNASGSTTSAAAALAIVTTSDPGRVLNLSIRAVAGTGAEIPIIGFVLGGSGTKPLLVRSVGPSLAAYGVASGFLVDPQLALYSGSVSVAANDNWAGDNTIAHISGEVGAAAFVSNDSKDAALYNPEVASGIYTVHTIGVNNTTGIVLAEVYDGHPSVAGSAKLMNVSGRAKVGSGDNVVIAGFVVGGTTPVRLLVRGVGPTLAGQQVSSPLPDPKLAIYHMTDGTSTPVASNDNWGGDTALNAAFTSVGAFALPPDSKDAALLLDFAPGVYTAVLSSANISTGIALIEVYVVEQPTP